MVDDELRASKSNHDMRQAYTTVMEKLVITVKQASISGNLHLWSRSLLSWFSHGEQYCKNPAIAKEIRNRLLIAKNSTSSMTGIRDNKMLNMKKNNIDNELYELERLIYEQFRELMLPISSDEETDLTLEGFMEGSDL